MNFSDSCSSIDEFELFIDAVERNSAKSFSEYFKSEYLNSKDKNSMLPIHIACYEGHTQMVQMLISKKCDLEACTKYNCRPVHFACARGHLDILKILVNQNCNIHSHNKDHWQPVHLACACGHTGILQFLIDQKCNLETCADNNLRPVHLASAHGQAEILKVLIDNKCDLEICADKNLRPIHFACANDRVEVLQILIDHNCDIEACADFNLSPMVIAERNKDLINMLNAGVEARQLRQQISAMGLQCNSQCDHKLCPKSLESKKFHRGEEIGHGAFGTVFHCKGSGIDRSFAIKFINYTKFDKRDIELNINSFLPMLKNARIVQYFGAIKTESELCIFMEFLPLGSLNDKISRERSIKPDNVIRYSRQILEGLEFLHGKKIIHRDLKPGNILMDDENNIKLADFGISRLLIRTDGISIDTKSFAGTPNFTAPEIMSGDPYNVPADIWSLGATIINMITSQPPYHDLETPWAVIFKIGNEKKLELPSDISEEMRIFILDLLQPDPKDRPTAAELLKSKFLSQ